VGIAVVNVIGLGELKRALPGNKLIAVRQQNARAAWLHSPEVAGETA
jgi:hypothetical protein